MGAKTSAGLLMFRRHGSDLEVLLAHPGGPFFRNRDAGAWTIPKGETAGAEEDLLERAQIEWKEELGVAAAPGEWIPLGHIRQKGGKTVHAWCFEGDLPAGFELRSNTFALEWPPRSGRIVNFPEVDRVAFFSLAAAHAKINPAQQPFLDRLAAHLTLASGDAA